MGEGGVLASGRGKGVCRNGTPARGTVPARHTTRAPRPKRREGTPCGFAPRLAVLWAFWPPLSCGGEGSGVPPHCWGGLKHPVQAVGVCLVVDDRRHTRPSRPAPSSCQGRRGAPGDWTPPQTYGTGFLAHTCTCAAYLRQEEAILILVMPETRPWMVRRWAYMRLFGPRTRRRLTASSASAAGAFLQGLVCHSSTQLSSQWGVLLLVVFASSSEEPQSTPFFCRPRRLPCAAPPSCTDPFVSRRSRTRPPLQREPLTARTTTKVRR